MSIATPRQDHLHALELLHRKPPSTSLYVVVLPCRRLLWLRLLLLLSFTLLQLALCRAFVKRTTIDLIRRDLKNAHAPCRDDRIDVPRAVIAHNCRRLRKESYRVFEARLWPIGFEWYADRRLEAAEYGLLVVKHSIACAEYEDAVTMRRFSFSRRGTEWLLLRSLCGADHSSYIAMEYLIHLTQWRPHRSPFDALCV